MNTLNEVLETALQLPYEQQEMLIKILQKRHHESCRAEMAVDAKKTWLTSMQENFNTSQPKMSFYHCASLCRSQKYKTKLVKIKV